MSSHRLLGNIFTLSVLILVLHLLASEFFWYWKFWWFDILMHLLGGFVIGLCVLWVIHKMTWRGSTLAMFVGVVTATLVIGIGWEVFEYIYGIAGKDNYQVDTVTDLIMDAIGAVLACKYVYKRHQHIVPAVIEDAQ